MTKDSKLDVQNDIILMRTCADEIGAAESTVARALMSTRDIGTRQLMQEIALGLRLSRDRLVAAMTTAMVPASEMRERMIKAEESESVASYQLPAILDIRALTARGRDNIKWYDPNTTLGDIKGSSRRTLKRGIGFHHSAIAGGAGTHKGRRDFWAKHGVDFGELLVADADGKMQPVKWHNWQEVVSLKRMSDQELLDAWCRAMALADRYRGYPSIPFNEGFPYHVVRGANSVLVLNLPFDWVTWHGDGMNTWFLGFAWDALSSKDELDEDDMLRDIEATMRIGRDEGHFADGCEWTMHCCWTNKPADAGKEFAQMLVANASRFNATVNLDFKANEGCRSIREVLER